MQTYKNILVKALDKARHNARTQLKNGLALCTDGQQTMFKKMYAYHDHKHLQEHDMSMTIEEVVDNLPENKLRTAMQQVQRTLDKRP